ncbi:SurA N-terminal domain-containing protein [uncultured Anaerococcus sp.]|uniref:SurA N-terminal domain-containing protein n=1 Tax=uncultured Anaerococcus sp. TaxID=293428 RepID=UPI00288A2EDC|nr:SurA N-terminal domain-containing protein [uncultured Anaerococcus sp.]
MKIRKKKNLIAKTNRIFICITILTLILVGCRRKENSDGDYLALVNGRPISSESFSKELKFYQNYYSKLYGEEYLDKKDKNGNTNDEILRKELLDSMIKDQVMVDDLKKNKVFLNDNDSSKLKSYLEGKINDYDSLKANVEALGISGNSFDEVIYNDSIRKAHYYMFLAKENIKDSDVLEFYNKNKNLQKMYKYNAIIFDDENEAKLAKESIRNSSTFRKYINNEIRDFSIINSDFVYAEDEMLHLSKVKEKDKPSDVFKFHDKYVILMINSYNENKNELLIKAKDIYQKNIYLDYLNKLTKDSKIKLFV